jgi:hypothetical protein
VEESTVEHESISAVRERLEQAGVAHEEYEATALRGVRDEEWPAWYAGYLVEHGLGELLPGLENAEALAAMLAELDADYRREQPADGWPEFYAARLVAGWS